MKKKNVILSSILSLVLCLSLIAGGTFALFTSESKTNIAVTSGNVEVVAWIDDIETATFGKVRSDKTFELGGSAAYDTASNKLTVDKIAPGDSVNFNVYIENNSNIAVSYRVKVAFVGELQDALVANITLPGDKAATVLTSADIATSWNSFDDTNQVKLPMSVELPYGVGNDYMNKSAEIIVTVEAVQGNATELVMIENTKYESLAAAIAAAKDGQTISLSGVFTIPTDGSLRNRTLTIKSIEDSVAVFNMNAATGQSTSGANLTFDGITLVAPNNHDGSIKIGIQHVNSTTFKNSTIKGNITMYGKTAIFEKCEFINYADYNVWTYGVDTTFTDCTFTTGGKAILVYNDGTTDDTVTVTGCTFNSNGQLATDKAAIETGVNTADSKHTLVINNSTADGFAYNNSNSPLWGNKNSMDKDHLSVTIDGQSVNTHVNKYTITSDEELKNILTNVGKAGAGNSIIELTANVALTETWTPMIVDGYHGADVIILNGNGHTISGLTAPLFAGGFAGGSGIVINDLTIADSTIVSTNTEGSGAFIEAVDSMDTITLKNCHLKNSSVTGSRTGGLIGWNSGYNNTNDGAVKTIVTVENCSVVNCNITGDGSVGGIIGHAGANSWTWNTIKNCVVKNCTLTSNDDSYRVGAIVGTANVGEVTITGCTSTGNTMLQNNEGTAIASPEGQSDLYGRFVPGTTGKLTIDGKSVQ